MTRHFLRSDLRAALWTLVLISALGTAMLVARVFVTGQFRQVYLVWNLFLAWVPLLLALRLEELDHTGRRGWRFRALAVAWLLFLPNAPYIFTDLIHITRVATTRIWTDLVLVLFFALPGLVLGFLSLQRVQALVARRRGAITGWGFALGVAMLSGFGVYLGRFERWNSWDVLANPLRLLADAVNWFNPRAALFTALFSVFLFSAHLLLHVLTLSGAAIHRRQPADNN
jgi:uncharacterized membrane protein